MPQRPATKPGILAISPYVGGKSQAKPGVRVTKLSSNESPLGASPEAVRAYGECSKTLYRYPDGGAFALREAIAEVHNLPMAKIVCGNGSDELIGLLLHAYAGEGDEVIISKHGFLMYQIYAQSFGATPVFAAEKNLCTDVDAMLASVTERTKVVCLANPNNPTGSYISKSELRRLHEGLPPHVLLIVDGAYAEYASEADYSAGRELVETSENVVMLRTFSKIYGLSALRIGWGYMPGHIADVLNRIRSPFNISGPAIAAGAAAMRDTDFIDTARQYTRQGLAWLAKELTALGLKVYPSIGNFILVEFGDNARASAANAHLSDRGIIVREVVNYGLPSCLRISIGLEEDNRSVVRALGDFLKAK